MKERNTTFISARRDLGLSQEELAERLATDPRTVRRWESGGTARPRAYQITAIEELFGRTAEELGFPPPPPAPEPAEPVRRTAADTSTQPASADTVEVNDGPWRGLDVVTTPVLDGAALTAHARAWLGENDEAPVFTGRTRLIDIRTVDTLDRGIIRLRRLDDAGSGGGALAAAVGKFNEVSGWLDNAAYDARTGRRLHAALGQLGQLAGWLSFDNGLQSAAQTYYLAGLAAAEEAGDRVLGSHILTFLGFQELWIGRPAQGLTLVQAAERGAPQAPHAVRAIRLNITARLHAAVGDTEACLRALDEADAELSRSDPADEPEWAYWITPGELALGAGHALSELGRADDARPRFEQGLLEADHDGALRMRVLYGLMLAEAYAKAGEADAAVDVGGEAVDMLELVDSDRVRVQARAAAKALEDNGPSAALESFAERVRASLHRH